MSLTQLARTIVVESMRRGYILAVDLDALRRCYFDLPVGIAIMVLCAEQLPVRS